MVPEDWRSAKLHELLETLETGTRPRGGAEEASVGIPSLGGENIAGSGNITYEPVRKIPREFFNELNRGVLEDLDVLVCKDGAQTGKVGLYKNAPYGEAAVNGHVFILRGDERLDQRFLFYFLLSHRGQSKLTSRTVGSAQPGLRKSFPQGLTVPLPPMAEQEKIAAILSSIDDAIAATRKVIEQTKRMENGLLQELLSCGIGHTEFKKTEIGELPEEWEVRRLRELVQPDRPICYGVLKPGPHVPGGVPVVRVGDYEDGTLDLDRVRRSAPEIVSDFPRSTLREGDLLISIRGTSGRVTKVPADLDGANISRDSARISVSDPSLADFLLYYLRTERAQVQVHGYVRGLAVKGINLRDLRPLPVPVPPVEERNRIVSILHGTGDVVRGNKRNLSELETLKRGLMQDLLTGRLRVPVD